jgi:sec-independent protein translocase protein TatA
MSVGPIELLVVFMVFLILGPRRIANLLRSLSRGAYDFVDTLGHDKKNELSEEAERDTEDEPRE